MRFVNLTPHAIVVQNSAGERLTFFPAGEVARVTTSSAFTAEVREGFPCPVQGPPSFGGVLGLPPEEDDVVLIVSGMVLEALRASGRRDICAPATGPADGVVRNDKGHVEAVTRLVVLR